MWRRILLFSATMFIVWAAKEQVKTFFSLERPAVEYVNHKYISNMSLWSRRVSRKSPIHYFGIDLNTTVIANNSFMMDFYFYEFLTNRYKPSFVEMHMKLCELIKNNAFFGEPARKAGLQNCPCPPGRYYLDNMMIPPAAIPRTFPFRKGRIYCNVTYIPEKELVTTVYVDMELKEYKEDKQ